LSGDLPKGAGMPGKSLIISLYLLFLPLLFAQADPGNKTEVKPAAPKDSRLAEGVCEYESFIGKCNIKSIRKSKESLAQANFLGGAGYQGYEVIFYFDSPDMIADPASGISYLQQRAMQLGFSLRGPHILQLVNSWYPGPEFLKKYKIREGGVFDCTLNIQKQGTCAPENFLFDAIDTTDYFEGKDQF
jgi:hypothetical protein